MKIAINGKSLSVPKNLRNALLLDFIRDFAGLRGTKFGCGAGLCGACTVHIDGTAVRSCQTALGEVEGREVTTIEGLAATASPGALHPVQKAWVEVAVPQCGYCQAGQIMSAAALLSRNPNPSSAQVREQMSGNLCRCGTYPRIREAIARAAKEMQDDTR